MEDENLSVSEHTAAHAEKVKGYKKLTEAEIDAINGVKNAGAVIEEIIKQLDETEGVEMDPRWKAMATTDLQVGIMKLTRAIAKPEFF